MDELSFLMVPLSKQCDLLVTRAALTRKLFFFGVGTETYDNATCQENERALSDCLQDVSPKGK